jgi:SAM-dependent MidA family methyltransferase
MADLLRTAGCFKGFNKAVSITLVEKSQRLMGVQQQRLKDFPIDIAWEESLPKTLAKTPLIMANEFLDALPICQYIYLGGTWRERMVGLDKSGFQFVASPQAVDPALLPEWLKEQPPEEGDILELSPATDSVVDQICSLILQGKGAACLIDYGYRHHAYGDSFQALCNHDYVDVFDAPGSADLTAHVNFARIVEIAEERGLKVYGTVTQGDFLRGMSIEHLAVLMMQQAEANNVAISPIKWGLERLIDPAQMGDLFKVVILMHPDGPTPKPFVGDHD